MNDEQMHFWTNDGLELPMRTTPIRFAVTKEGGFISNSWGVNVRTKGDAYVYCRDAMKGQKASLHASGKQHIKIDENVRRKASFPGDGFMNQWWEPQHSTNAVPTLRLLFPPWGLSLGPQQGAKVQEIRDESHVLIPAHDEMVTVVSFVIMDDGTHLQKAEGTPPSAPFGVLSLRPGKSLFVIAGYEPQGDLRAMADEALKKIARPPNVKLLDGEDLVVCLTGKAVENSTFMLPLSVRYRRRCQRRSKISPPGRSKTSGSTQRL